MALDACNDAIAQAIGRELTEREKGAVARRAQELKRKIDLAGNDPLAVQSVLGDFGRDIATQRAIQRRNAAINFRVGQEKDAWRKSIEFAKDRPEQVASGAFIQNQKNYFGAKDSLGTAQAREANSRTQAFTADLMKRNLFDYVFKSGDDRNIALARAALNDPKADAGALAAQYGKDAVEAAQVIMKHQEAVRADRNLAGAWTSRNSDYITSQTHDAYKIGRAGGHFGSDESFQQWASDLDRMDWNKSFDGEYADKTPEERLKLLRSQFNQFVSNKHLQFGSDGFGVGMQNLGRKASHERQIVFQTPEDAFNYWNKYGKHGSLGESVFNELSRGGRDIATMREWGPNAKQNINAWLDRWRKELNDTGTVAQQQAFDKVRTKIEKQYLPVLFDEIGSPESGWAHWLAASRQALYIAKTGASLPASLAGDPILRASYAMRYAGRKTVGSFLGEWGSAYKELLTGIGKEDQRTVAKEWGIRLHDWNLPLGTEYQERAGTGAISKWTQLVQKTLGHSWANNRQRTNHLAAEGFRDYSFRGKSFDQLPEGRRDLMTQFGISDKMWDIIRRSEPMELERGTKILAPSQVRAMDAEEFKAVANGDTETALKRARDLVADRYRNMYGELADTAVSEPNRNLRAIIYGKSVSMDPWQRELYRSFFGLKNFMANFMRNHLGGIALGQDANPNNVGWAKALVRTLAGVNGGSAFKMLATTMFMGQMMGYVRNSLGDVISGKTPEDPFDFSSEDGNWMHSPGFDAATRAFTFQTLGLLSDFVVSRGSRPGADFWDKLGGMMGPELETVGDVVDSVSRGAGHVGKWAADHNYSDEDFYRDISKDASGLAYTVYHSIPGNNVIWTKWATDALLLDNLMEALNPGYKQRLQQRAAKHGQTLLIGGPPQ